MTKPLPTFSLFAAEAALSARLGVKPIHRGSRTTKSPVSPRPVVEYIECVYPLIPLAKIKAAVSGLQAVQHVKSTYNKDAFFSESGHWVNAHPDAAFQLKMRRYRDPIASVRFTITPLVASTLASSMNSMRTAPNTSAIKPEVVKTVLSIVKSADWELRPIGCEFTFSVNRHWSTRTVQFV